MPQQALFAAIVQIFDRDKGWYYVDVPEELSRPLEGQADRGLIAVTAQVGSSAWLTSLLPMGNGSHFVALPAKVRTKEKIALGDSITVMFTPRNRER